jgi:pantoate--beta-alanine ligase
MGALHQGHLSLVETAKPLADIVAMSIFVNPLQFNNKEDLANYPNTLAKDLELAKKAGVGLVFAPSLTEIYPEEISTTVKAGDMAEGLCGAGRPGHFDGVATVVSILFNLFEPNFAVFGEKDFQQVKVIEQLNKELHFGINIVRSPLIRENSGLALSSRNSRLSSEQQETASLIYKALADVKKEFLENKVEAVELKAKFREHLKDTELKVEYAKALDELTLREVGAQSKKLRFFVAAEIAGIRLIDNLALY